MSNKLIVLTSNLCFNWKSILEANAVVSKKYCLVHIKNNVAKFFTGYLFINLAAMCMCCSCTRQLARQSLFLPTSSSK